MSKCGTKLQGTMGTNCLLVFHREDLCEVTSRMQSVLKFSDVLFALSQMYLPVETSHRQVWYYFGQADVWSYVPPW